MQIEAGKYYRTRDGRKVGPMRATDNSFWPMKCGETWWRTDGESCEGSMAFMYPKNDIVAEWSEGPVRTETVTTRRIVPGVYGRLCVGQVVNVPDCDRPDEPPRVEIDLELTGGYGLTATELDDLAMVASQLAEALRDQ